MIDAVTLVGAFYEAFDERPYDESIAPFLAEAVVWHVTGDNPLAGTFTGPTVDVGRSGDPGAVSDRSGLRQVPVALPSRLSGGPQHRTNRRP